MFRSQKSKSLKVQRETVRILAGSQLASAQGGGMFEGATAACEIATRQNTCPNPQLGGATNGTGVSQIVGGCGQVEITTGHGLPVSRLP
jgi:hypothetical protein